MGILAGDVLKHDTTGAELRVLSCSANAVTCQNLGTKEISKHARNKFEWMFKRREYHLVFRRSKPQRENNEKV